MKVAFHPALKELRRIVKKLQEASEEHRMTFKEQPCGLQTSTKSEG